MCEADRGKNNWCVVIPAYQEAGRIGAAVQGVRGHCEHVVVVDDGSTDGTGAEAGAAGAKVLTHGRNMGKGAALKTGIRYAREHGYDFVIAMDGDGQHDPRDIPALLEVRARAGARVVVGNRMNDPRSMPLVRRWTNRYMSWMLSRRMGQRVPDTQNGFRLYDAAVLDLLLRSESDGFAADSEVLLALAAAGESIGSAPVRIIYRDEVSKVRPLRDTARFFRMLNRHGQRAGRSRR